MVQNSLFMTSFHIAMAANSDVIWMPLLLTDKRFTGLKEKFFIHTIWQAVTECKGREG